MAQDELHFGMVKSIKNGEKHEVSWKKSSLQIHKKKVFLIPFGYLRQRTGKSPFWIGKSSFLSSINGPFSIAMLNNQPEGKAISQVEAKIPNTTGVISQGFDSWGYKSPSISPPIPIISPMIFP